MSTIITAIILMAVILIPFLLMRVGIKKKERKMINELKMLATTKEAYITTFEVLKDIAIGIDESRSLLFFIHENEHLASREMIDLSIYSNCHLEKIVSQIKIESGDRTIVERVNLLFKAKDGKEHPILLELFNADLDCPTLSGELQLAEKWEKLINKRSVA